MKELPEKFCILPFIHAVYNGFDSSNEEGRIRPCCRFNTQYSETTVVDNPLKKSELFLNLQKQFLNGETPEGCSFCWKAENSGNTSYRLDQLDNFKHLLDNDEYKKQELRFLEIMPGNACQLACRMCSPLFSSKWNRVHASINSNNNLPWDSYTDWKDIDITKLEHLKLMGGEPTYQKKNVEMLRYLDSIGRLEKMHIELPTNLHTIISEEWKYFLSKSKRAKIFVSIDGVGELNDYVRQYSVWKTFEKNLDDLIEFSKDTHISILTSVTISAFNVNQSKEIEEYIKSKGIKELNQFCTTYPNFLDVRILPTKVKKYLLENNLLTDSVSSIIREYLHHEDLVLLEKFKNYVKSLDSYHRTSFDKANPIISSFILG